MPYNFVVDNIHTKKLCSRLSSSEVHFLTGKGPFCVLSSLWGLKGNVAVLLMLIGKHVLLMLLELFSLAATSEYRLKIGVFAGTGSVWPKIFRYKGSSPSTIFFCQKTR